MSWPILSNNREIYQREMEFRGKQKAFQSATWEREIKASLCRQIEVNLHPPRQNLLGVFGQQIKFKIDPVSDSPFRQRRHGPGMRDNPD